MRIRSVPFQAPPSAKAFIDQRDAILRHLRALLGWPPIAAAPPLSPVDCYRSDCGSYVRHKVRYGNETDDVVWAWLLVPTRLTDPVPAVICLPGSFMTPNWGRDAPAGLAGPEHAGTPKHTAPISSDEGTWCCARITRLPGNEPAPAGGRTIRRTWTGASRHRPG